MLCFSSLLFSGAGGGGIEEVREGEGRETTPLNFDSPVSVDFDYGSGCLVEGHCDSENPLDCQHCSRGLGNQVA